MSRTIEKIAFFLLGVILFAGPSLGRAEDEFSDTLSTDQLYKFGMESARNKGWARAREALEKWLKREKPTVEVLNTLGQAQLYEKDEKDAEKSFRGALGIDKNDLQALEGLCEVHLIREKDKDGTVRKDLGIPKAEVEGFFRSKTGEHFASFGQLENVLKDSVSLKVIDPVDTTPAPEGGVNFSVRLKQKDV
mgnify:CR=1 FL=1